MEIYVLAVTYATNEFGGDSVLCVRKRVPIGRALLLAMSVTRTTQILCSAASKLSQTHAHIPTPKYIFPYIVRN